MTYSEPYAYSETEYLNIVTLIKNIMRKRANELRVFNNKPLGLRNNHQSRALPKLGMKTIGLVIHLFSEYFIVSPKFLSKIMPRLYLELLNFPPFFFGIYHHGVSHPNTEYLLHEAVKRGIITKREFKKREKFWQKPKIKYKLLSNLSPSQIDRIAREIGLSLSVLKRKIRVLATEYGGNPENIEEKSIKWVLNRFLEPTAWLYWSVRWEKEKLHTSYKGLRQFHVGPVSVPLPDFTRELRPAKKLIFEIYGDVLSKKEEENIGHHFRINQLKKDRRFENLSGEKVFLFGHLLDVPIRLKDGTERLLATFCDSPFFPNEGHRIKIFMDGSVQANFERNPEELAKYQVMLLGAIDNNHINTTAILKISELSNTFFKKGVPDNFKTLLDFV